LIRATVHNRLLGWLPIEDATESRTVQGKQTSSMHLLKT